MTLIGPLIAFHAVVSQQTGRRMGFPGKKIR
jgi:hypothetical protein